MRYVYTLFDNFLKWRSQHISNKHFIIILSILIGFISGIGSLILKNTTFYISNLLTLILLKKYYILHFFFPIIGITLVIIIIRYLIKRKVSHGIPTTLHAISQKKGILERYQMLGSILTAPITVGFGGSVGLEGPTVSTGAAVSSNISRLFHLNQTSRTLLIGCAAAGALSSIFKAPIAAIIFAVEVFSLDLTLASLLPLLVASLSATLTSYFFFGSEILLPFDIKDKFSLDQIPTYLTLGVISGLTCIYFTKIYDRFNIFFDSLSTSIKKLLIGGLSFSLLIYFIPALYGEGFEVINFIIQGDINKALESHVFNFDLKNTWLVIGLLFGLAFFKVIASCLTFGAGGIGGIFAPTLFMGSIMGYATAKLINTLDVVNYSVSESNFALIGMAGLMSGILHAPLTAIFLIAELTGGYQLFVPLMIVAAVSFSITKYITPHSVYHMELGRKGDLITHNKDHAVLTLMDINIIIEKNFIKIYPEMTLGEIVKKAVVKSNRNIFPVVKKNSNEFIGIILLDDIRTIMFNADLYENTKAIDLVKVAPEIIYLNKDKMTTIMKKFENSNAWNLPLVEKNKYLGFISKSKLLTAYRNKLIEVTH